MSCRKIRKNTYALSINSKKVFFQIGLTNEEEIIIQTNIANLLKMSISTANDQFTKLKQRGLIDNFNKLTNRGKKLFRYYMRWDKTYQKKVRAHNIQFTLFLSRYPDISKIKNYVFTPISNRKYKGYKVEMEDFKVLFYSSTKAVVVLQDIFGNNDEEISAALVLCIDNIIKILELEFPGLKIKYYKSAKLNSMHVAVLDSYIAESFILNNNKIYSDGKICVDKSNGRYELELINKDNALENINVFVNYDEVLRENKKLKKELEELKLLNYNNISKKTSKKN